MGSWAISTTLPQDEAEKKEQLPDPWAAPEPVSSLPALGARLGMGDDS